MASRLNLGRAKDYVESVASDASDDEVEHVVKETALPEVTAGLVDEAVEDVLSQTDYQDDVKETMRKLMASDVDADFATSYHRGNLKPVNVHSKLEKPVVNISYVMTSEETADLAGYASEFDLRFLDSDNHDHAMAAAMRVVDTAIILLKTPRGVVTKDVGGDPMVHVRRGLDNVHVCSPVVDLKDPSRAPMRRMAAKRILAVSDDPVKCGLARMYLEGDQRFVCGKKAQECEYQAKLSISVHVYDVPIEDWPLIMANCGAIVHEGVILYPTAALDQAVGLMPKARARYELDVAKDKFRMGFVGSPSWWYEHSWSKFMRYGSDQILNYGGFRYSYRVTERRGDTLFFRIMKLDGAVGRIGRQYYNVPGLHMVRVDGFTYSNTEKTRVKPGLVVRAKREPAYFPARLWKDMLREASMRFEQGDASFDKLYNYYRVVSPRHTINGVLVAGGERVGMEQIVDLIVRCGMCAASRVMLEQRSSRLITGAAMADREWGFKQSYSKVLTLFLSGVSSIAKGMVYYPLVWLCDVMLSRFSQGMSQDLFSWEEEPDVKEFPFSSLLEISVRDKYYDNVRSNTDPVDPEFMLDLYGHNAPADHMRVIRDHPNLAKIVQDANGDTGDVMKKVVTGSTVISSNEETLVNDKVDTVVTEEDVNMRRNAIRECIEESILEKQQLMARCERIYRECVDARGLPVTNTLRKKAEEFHQPDLWWITGGVIGKSQLGVDGKDCRFSALFTPTPDGDGVKFRTVKDESYDSGEETIEYRVFTDNTYTGWALSIDRLLIYNGPEIQETLRLAIDLSHDYTVVLQQGPPGCGKTYDLLNAIEKEDVAMCPVRESAMDTRSRLGQKQPDFPNLRGRVRTVDSYLVNHGSDRVKSLVANALHADEVYMTHSGKWYAAAALLGAKVVYAYGDVNQIPHVPRVQASKAYLRIRANEQRVKYDIYRCPADALAAWGSIFDWRVRTHSEVRNSIRVVTDSAGLMMPRGCVLMCMYQADKKALMQKHASVIERGHARVMTVHESEGKTFRDVWLYRFDTRARQDDMSLYDKTSYALVAMSRHTQSFAYIRPRNLGDKVDQWAARSQDVRALAAMVDLESVGVPMQFK